MNVSGLSRKNNGEGKLVGFGFVHFLKHKLRHRIYISVNICQNIIDAANSYLSFLWVGLLLMMTC